MGVWAGLAGLPLLNVVAIAVSAAAASSKINSNHRVAIYQEDVEANRRREDKEQRIKLAFEGDARCIVL